MLVVLIISNNDVVCHSYSDIYPAIKIIPKTWFPILIDFFAGSEDEARHSEVRSYLPRPAGGAGQRQAEGKGEHLLFLI